MEVIDVLYRKIEKRRFSPVSPFAIIKKRDFSKIDENFITLQEKGAEFFRKSPKCKIRNSAKTLYIRDVRLDLEDSIGTLGHF